MKKLIIILLVWAIMVASLGVLLQANEQELPSETKTVVVKKGETLWDIASRFNDGSFNTHRIIDRIEKLNDLDTVVITPGQRLEVPRKKEEKVCK